MTQMRKGIAAQMTRALAGAPRLRPHGGRRDRLVAARERAKRDYQAREGISLSYVPFVVKAAVGALKRNPTFNAHWTEHGLLAKRRIHMGVAVAVDDGLLVPVVRDVDQLSISGLNRRDRRRRGPGPCRQAQARRLRRQHVHHRQHRLVRLQPHDADHQRPRGRDPDDGGDHQAPGRPATPDGDVIAIRPVMNMVLAIDHRANDGAGGRRSSATSRPGSRRSGRRRRSTDRLRAVGPHRPVT